MILGTLRLSPTNIKMWINVMTEKFDLVVFGASGFTGRLVAEYLSKKAGVSHNLNWALAGRDVMKLESVKEEMQIPLSIPILQVDASDRASIKNMIAKTNVVLTTVGPYQIYGNELIECCVEAGTDYLDLCGEPAWMHKVIETHQARAESTGARIVFSCGFDSIPFDLGVYALQRKAILRFGGPMQRVKGRVRSMKGTFSGGTLASFQATMAAAAKDKDIVSVLRNPFALTSDFSGVNQPPGNRAEFDESINSWVAPFVMASINTKNIHRSNYLLNHMYGEDFKYDEMIATGPGEEGEAIAVKMSQGNPMAGNNTKPGEGPSKAERESGSYDIVMIGENAKNQTIRLSVKGDKDPGYGSTSKMIAESGIWLSENPSQSNGGIWTAASLMGISLVESLEKNAGITFTEESKKQ